MLKPHVSLGLSRFSHLATQAGARPGQQGQGTNSTLRSVVALAATGAVRYGDRCTQLLPSAGSIDDGTASGPPASVGFNRSATYTR